MNWAAFLDFPGPPFSFFFFPEFLSVWGWEAIIGNSLEPIVASYSLCIIYYVVKSKFTTDKRVFGISVALLLASRCIFSPHIHNVPLSSITKEDKKWEVSFDWEWNIC